MAAIKISRTADMDSKAAVMVRAVEGIMADSNNWSIKSPHGRALYNTRGADPSAQPLCGYAECQFNGGTTKGRQQKARLQLG